MILTTGIPLSYHLLPKLEKLDLRYNPLTDNKIKKIQLGAGEKTTVQNIFYRF